MNKDEHTKHYCVWERNKVFPEQINNPHVNERENISTAKYCICCGKEIKITDKLRKLQTNRIFKEKNK